LLHHCSIEVRDANNTYELATNYGAQQDSGSYHFGFRQSMDAKSDEKLQILWEALEHHTGCTYSDI
jgi:hypothetical protein